MHTNTIRCIQFLDEYSHNCSHSNPTTHGRREIYRLGPTVEYSCKYIYFALNVWINIIGCPNGPQVWGAVAVTMLTFAPTVYIMHILSLRIRGEDSSTKSSVLDVTVQLFHFMVSSLVQQSTKVPTLF